jgi:hypothetical protein
MSGRLKHRKLTQVNWILLLGVFAALSSSPAAFAQRDHKQARPAAPQWHGDIARFHERDWHTWRGGHWAHSRHDGRWGWWWVVGPAWYFYPTPVYPYPSPWEPPAVAIVSPPAPPPTQYWYYCEAAGGYYPYVPTCPGGWKEVPATPSAVPTR